MQGAATSAESTWGEVAALVATAAPPLHNQSPLTNGEDDWLPPAFNSHDIADLVAEDLLEPIPNDLAARAGHAPHDDEEPLDDDALDDDFFERPSGNRQSAMRQAFSMNDLQSLHLQPQPPVGQWNPGPTRLASVKPSLESVPERSPLTLDPSQTVSPRPVLGGGTFGTVPGQFIAPPPMAVTGTVVASDGFDYLSPEALESCMAGISAQTPPLPSPCPPLVGISGQPMAFPTHMMQPAMAHHQQPQFFGMNKGGYMGAGQNMMMAPQGFQMMMPPEHMMTDVKAEPDSDSSGGPSGEGRMASHRHQHVQQMMMNQQAQHPQQQQSSGDKPMMRKSQSALELGAWQKMAAGDLDFVDPSGSVREQLQGLDFLQQIGKLTPEERLQKILRYRAKRQLRNFNRTIKYQCRKSLADTRPRVRGRFARDNEPGSVLPHETKKATQGGGAGGPGSNGPQDGGTSSPSPPPSHQQQQRDASFKAEERGPGIQQPFGVGGPAFASTSDLPFPSAGGGAATAEQNTSLESLYNQWSELGGPMQPAGALATVPGSGSSNSA